MSGLNSDTPWDQVKTQASRRVGLPHSVGKVHQDGGKGSISTETIVFL